MGLSDTFKSVYFIGIGGVSMSSLALILKKDGKEVRGYDMKPSETTALLENNGICVDYDVNISNISACDTVVYTAAIKQDDTMLVFARNSGKNILTRAELLGMITGGYDNSIGVSGTHGKSTTTGFMTQVLLCANSDATILSGAGLPALNGSLYRVGNGNIAAFEACEYQNSYHHMHPTIKIVLNCEHDHVDFFPTLDDVLDSFTTYLNIPGKNGVNIGIINADNDNAVKAARASSADLRFYSVKNTADVYACNIDLSDGYGKFDLMTSKDGFLGRVELSVPGIHNISNAVAAATAALECSVDKESIIRGLGEFSGVKRRFERVGVLPGGAVVIDDYAHHPDEIAVTLAAARKVAKGRVICIFQPHTYSRTKALLGDFAKVLSSCNLAVLAPIYAAREQDVYGVSSNDLAGLIPGAKCFQSFGEIASYAQGVAVDGDLVITMGAGDIYKVSDYFLFA